MKLLPERAVLLDALGTLVELPPPAPALAEEVRARFGVRITAAQAEAAMAAEIAFYRAHLDEGRDEESLATLRRACAEVLASHLPLPAASRRDPAPLVSALLGALRFRAYPDAAPALRDLRARGFRLVVLSNWDASLPGVLERVGLAQDLDGVVTSATVGHRKPAGEVFRRGLALAGVSAERAWHVGDGLEEDVAGALAAGIRPVLIARHGSPPPERLPPGVSVIASLAELEI